MTAPRRSRLIVGFGDCIIDRDRHAGECFPGGNCANVAVFAQRLGAKGRFVGVRGDDQHGERIRSALDDCGVDTTWMVERIGETGTSDFDVVDGERIFREWNQGGVTRTQPFRLAQEGSDWLTDASVVHSSVYGHVLDELAAVRARGIPVSFDFSSEEEYRTDEFLARVGASVDLAVFSCSDLSMAQTVVLLRRARSFGPRIVVGTRGMDGSILIDGDDVFEQAAVPVPAARLVDTMGCGDAFVTALALHLVDELRTPSSHDAERRRVLRAALRRAAGFAAEQCSIRAAFGYGWRCDSQHPV